MSKLLTLTMAGSKNSKTPSLFPDRFTLLVKEEESCGHKAFVAHCVEYNLCVQGKDEEQVKSRFVDAIRSHVVIALRFGIVPFASIQNGVTTGDTPRMVKGRTYGNANTLTSKESSAILQFTPTLELQEA